MSTKSVPGLFGGIIHYDENGNEVGYSWEGVTTGGYNHYDANGNMVGYSDRGVFASYVHSDASGHRLGATYESMPGYYSSYGEDGFTGTTVETCYGADSDFDFDF